MRLKSYTQMLKWCSCLLDFSHFRPRFQANLRSRLRKFLEKPKVLSGHMDCTFKNPGENFPPNVRKHFTQSL